MSEKLTLAIALGLTVLGIHYQNAWVLLLVLVAALGWAIWVAGTLLWGNRRRLVRYLPHAVITLGLQGAFFVDRWVGISVCGLFVLTAITVILKEHSYRTASSSEFVKTSFRVSGLLGWNMLVGLLWTTIKLSI